MELIHRFLPIPKESCFLFGPRGTGKSTWTQTVFKDAIHIDLLAPDVFRLYAAKPERLRETIGADPRAKTVVIDEIQLAPGLLPMVHALIEEKRGVAFVMTGSSSRKLKRTGADLLAGRAVMRTLHPFMAAEVAESFDLGRALNFGLLPLVWRAEDPGDVIRAYAGLYVRDEVQMEGMVRDIGDFSRFLEAISFSHSSLLNLSNVARECQVERNTAAGYVQILEDLTLAFRLPVFRKRAERAVAVHPKFYYFDAGVYRSVRPKGPLDRAQEIDGHALEGLVAQHLRAWNAYGGERFQLYFWRTRSGVEVDFVVYGPDGFWALEVKNTDRVRDEELRGLRTFLSDFPEAKALYLYRGSRRLKVHGILCLPCEEFFKGLVPGKGLDF